MPDARELSPEVLVSFSVPALGLQQQLSFILQLKRHNGQSLLNSVMELLRDCILDLEQKHECELDLDLDSETTNATIEAFQAKAQQDLAEWHRRLKVADEQQIKADSAKTKMNDMRSAYFKEIDNLKQQLLAKKKVEAQGGEYKFIDLDVFDPELYTFDDETSQIVKQKAKVIQDEFNIKHQELYDGYETKRQILDDRLQTAQNLLEKKDQLLTKLMEKHGYQSELTLERDIECRRSREVDGCDRRKSQKSRAWSFFGRGKTKTTNLEVDEQEVEGKESFVRGMLRSVEQKFSRSNSKHRKASAVNKSVVCDKECGAAGMSSDCAVISKKDLADSNGQGAPGHVAEPLDNPTLETAFAGSQARHKRKLMSEQSTQSDIAGHEFDQAWAKYGQVWSEDQWEHLLPHVDESQGLASKDQWYLQQSKVGGGEETASSRDTGVQTDTVQTVSLQTVSVQTALDDVPRECASGTAKLATTSKVDASQPVETGTQQRKLHQMPGILDHDKLDSVLPDQEEDILAPFARSMSDLDVLEASQLDTDNVVAEPVDFVRTSPVTTQLTQPPDSSERATSNPAQNVTGILERHGMQGSDEPPVLATHGSALATPSQSPSKRLSVQPKASPKRRPSASPGAALGITSGTGTAHAVKRASHVAPVTHTSVAPFQADTQGLAIGTIKEHHAPAEGALHAPSGNFVRKQKPRASHVAH